MKNQPKLWEQKLSKDLTADEIRRHCKSDLKAWDEFLKADVEVPCQEVLLEDPCAIDGFAVGYNDLVDEPKPEATNSPEIAFVP